jgi:hypothetical protein
MLVIMKWKGFGRKQTWANRGNIPPLYLEGLRKTMKMLSD